MEIILYQKENLTKCSQGIEHTHENKLRQDVRKRPHWERNEMVSRDFETPWISMTIFDPKLRNLSRENCRVLITKLLKLKSFLTRT